jgi:hypothetical protein
MKYATGILAIGANWGISEQYESVNLILDGTPLAISPQNLWFFNGGFNIGIEFPTTVGTHDFCAQAAGIEACMQLIVCDTCGPRIGFVDSYNISSPTADYLRGSQFTLTGDGFHPGESLEIYIDDAIPGNILAQNIIVLPNGRFEVSLTIPSNATLGSHEMFVFSYGIGDYKLQETWASFDIVEFIFEK